MEQLSGLAINKGTSTSTDDIGYLSTFLPTEEDDKAKTHVRTLQENYLEGPEPTLSSSTMEACRKVLKDLMDHHCAFPFNVPVDPVALNIPDYFQIITQPMDFGTILQKVNSEQYNSMEEFCYDIELVFGNACTYNSPTSDVYIMAVTLKNLYKKKVQVLEDKEKESKGNQAGIGELKKTVDAMRQELILLRPMTKKEKKKLSTSINSLAGENLVVVNIIKEKLTNIANTQKIDNKTYQVDQKKTSKMTETETQSRILDVQRQLQELKSKSAALTRSGTFPTPATPNSAIIPTPISPGVPTSLCVSSVITPKKAESSESSESSESTSESMSS